jgi:hypothetical protein
VVSQIPEGKLKLKRKILFLTPFSHAFLAYPLQKHKRALQSEGVLIKVSTRIPENIEKYNCVIITRAFFVSLARKASQDRTPHDLVKQTADWLHEKCVKFIFFDDRDSTASGFFEVLPYVDVFLKRQHLRDLETYADESYAKGHSEWLVSDKPRYFPPARPDQVSKIRLAWNVGFENFGRFRKLAKVASWYGITWSPVAIEPDGDREIITGFRGALGGSRRSHRQAAIDAIERSNVGLTKSRGRVSRRKYIQEMRNSLTAVSPFGFGEPCYRDFEAILAGALLIKPDMSHLKTYPNVYDPNKTYVPVRWDFKDLEDTLATLLSERELMLQISRAAQLQYLEQLNSSRAFTRFFLDILDAPTSRAGVMGGA